MIILKNAKIFNHYLDSRLGRSDSYSIVDIAFEGDRIFQIADSIDDMQNAQIIDVKNRWVMPGFFDPQVHFRYPGADHKETIESGSRAAARGGFTSVVTMPNTNPTTDCVEVLQKVIHEAKRVGLVKIFPTASVTKGLLGQELTDFAALKKAGAIALTDDGKGVQSDELMLQAMHLARQVRLPILDHAEDESLSAGGAIHAGKTAATFGVRPIVSESEAQHVLRGCEMSLATGARYHVLHVSCAKSLSVIKRFREKGAKVTVEVSPHHLLLSDEDIKLRSDGSLDSNFKMNPPIRSPFDRIKLNEAFLSGEIDAVATDHAPHSQEEKARSIELAPFGIVGVETAFPLIYTNYYLANKMPLFKIVDLMTCHAAKIFELNMGTITKGGLSDLVVIDAEMSETIDARTFLSKGKNTPFQGMKVKGIPVLTICSGRITFKHRLF
jgi:dihydroorotase